MADPPPHRESKNGIGVGPNRGSTTSYPGTPRWVKVFGIIGLALILLLSSCSSPALVATVPVGIHGPAALVATQRP